MSEIQPLSGDSYTTLILRVATHINQVITWFMQHWGCLRGSIKWSEWRSQVSCNYSKCIAV